MGKWIDIIGNTYNKLKVIEYLGKSKWKCLCECGNYTSVITGDLKNNNTKTCGCKVGSFLNMSRSSTYDSWTDMKGRCYNKNYKNYKYYGGRGITVCDEWKDSFENFYNDMGEKPKSYSIDRIDVNGNYEKDNCRWSTIDVQNANKRNNKIISFKGEDKPLIVWCKELNLNYSCVINRLNQHKWSQEKALSTPTKKPFIKKTNKTPILSVKDLK